MIIPAYLFFELVIIILVLAVSLGTLGFFFSKTLKRVHTLEKQNENLKTHTAEKAEHLIEKARIKATELITDANVFNQDTRETFDKELAIVYKTQAQELQNMSEEMLKLYQFLMNQIKEDALKTFQGVKEQIQEENIRQVNDFKEVLERETVQSQK